MVPQVSGSGLSHPLGPVRSPLGVGDGPERLRRATAPQVVRRLVWAAPSPALTDVLTLLAGPTAVLPPALQVRLRDRTTTQTLVEAGTA
jgi:hypothetical protein